MTPEEKLKRMLDRTRGPDQVSEEGWREFATAARRSLRVQRMVAGAVALLVIAAAAFGAAAIFDGDGNGPDVEPIRPPVSEDDAPPPPPTQPPDLKDEMEPPPFTPRVVEIWVINNSATLSWGSRIVPVEEGRALASVIEALLSGPTDADAEARWPTEIPSNVELLGADVRDGVATIDLSQEFLADDPEGNPGSMRLREAQVVFTATQLPQVNEVQILVEGEPFLGQTQPGDRRDFHDIAPPIVVEAPEIGAQVTSPFPVAGTADVFEATVSIELALGKGTDPLVKTFATATCGTGCRGDFSKDVSFEVDRPTEARLEVYEESAYDGSKAHVISLPITLMPND